MPILKRALFILQEFSHLDITKLKQSSTWQSIKGAEDLRNGLIHQKKGVSLERFTLKTAERTRQSVVDFVKLSNRAIFRKNLDL